MFGRTFVESPQDVTAVNEIQAQYRVVPLSLWGKAGATLPENRDVWAPYDRNADWKTINRAMAENPPPTKDKQLLDMFAAVGIGAGLDDKLANLDEASKRGLARAAAGGRPMVEGMLAAGISNKIVKGWLYPSPNQGRQGAVDDDFRGRAICAIGGIICNDAPEAVYLVAVRGVDGQPVDGANRYTLRFENGALPPVKEFWSLTMYDPATI